MLKKLSPRCLALTIWILAAGCANSDLEFDRFTDSIAAASAKDMGKATYVPRIAGPYSVVILKGPKVERSLLQKAGLSDASLDSILQGAPRDFTLAVAVVTPQRTQLGWFLGNYVLSESSKMVSKGAGEPVTINLRYGGSLPEIISIE
jgi:hypothetical protein